VGYIKTGGIMTIQGLDTSKPSEYISEINTPNCQNMSVNRSVLCKRGGLTAVGDPLNTDEIVMRGAEFSRAGVNYVVRIGTDKIEEWDDANDEWDDITSTALGDLTADADDPVDVATPLLTGQRILCITNGVDAIRKTLGTTTTLLGGDPPKAKYMTEFDEYLVLAYVDDGTPRPMRVQWCDTADPETWSGGNSGAKDLVEDGEDISGIARFGNFISVHKQTAIYLGYKVSSSTIFKFDRKNVIGTICNNTIQTLPTGEQAYLATDGIRVFNGTSADLIQGRIANDLREGINPEYVHRCWSIVVNELDEYWCAVPIGSDEYPNSIYKYNYRTGAVHKDTRMNITCAWKYTLSSQPSWDDQTLTWDEMSARWDDRGLQNLFKVVMLGDYIGYTAKLDNTVYDDRSVAVDAYWETKDYESEELGRLCQWVGMDLWAKGNTVTVEYSTDSGKTWTEMTGSPVTLTDDYPADDDPINLWIDVVSSKIRFRFKNDTSNSVFYLKQFVIKYRNREMR